MRIKYRNSWINQPSNRWRFADGDGDAGTGDQGDAGSTGDTGTGDQGDAGAGSDVVKFLDSAPADWREQIAGDDKGKLNQLTRLGTFTNFTDTYFSAQDMIRTGEISALQAPGEGATDEEITVYRDKIGVPATAEDYALTLDDGLTLGDEDKAIMDQVFASAHVDYLPTGAVSNLTNAFLKARETEIQKAELKQEEYKKETMTLLNDTWRGETQANLNLIAGTILGRMPESVRGAFEKAVMPDGRMIFNCPEIVIAFADMARVINPMGTVVPNAGNQVKAVADEIIALEKTMRETIGDTGPDGWHKNKVANERLDALYEAREAAKAAA